MSIKTGTLVHTTQNAKNSIACNGRSSTVLGTPEQGVQFAVDLAGVSAGTAPGSVRRASHFFNISNISTTSKRSTTTNHTGNGGTQYLISNSPTDYWDGITSSHAYTTPGFVDIPGTFGYFGGYNWGFTASSPVAPGVTFSTEVTQGPEGRIKYVGSLACLSLLLKTDSGTNKNNTRNNYGGGIIGCSSSFAMWADYADPGTGPVWPFSAEAPTSGYAQYLSEYVSDFDSLPVTASGVIETDSITDGASVLRASWGKDWTSAATAPDWQSVLTPDVNEAGIMQVSFRDTDTGTNLYRYREYAYIKESASLVTISKVDANPDVVYADDIQVQNSSGVIQIGLINSLAVTKTLHVRVRFDRFKAVLS